MSVGSAKFSHGADVSHSVTAALRLHYLLYLCVSLLIFLHCCMLTASTLHECAAQDKEFLCSGAKKKLMEWSCSPGKGAESALKLQRALRTDPHTTERQTDRQTMVGLSWDSPMSVSLSRSVTRPPSPACAPRSRSSLQSFPSCVGITP